MRMILHNSQYSNLSNMATKNLVSIINESLSLEFVEYDHSIQVLNF